MQIPLSSPFGVSLDIALSPKELSPIYDVPVILAVAVIVLAAVAVVLIVNARRKNKLKEMQDQEHKP
ncbi:MAG: hypothetical protein LLF87_11420 [Eubacteriales bacterium]|nr:hypothetical protein [Eubacteriales bacterium]